MIVKGNTKKLLLLFSTACYGLSGGCSKGKDSDPIADATSGATSGGVLSEVNKLAEAFPLSLALSAFPQSTSSTSLLLAEEAVDDPNAKLNVKDRVEENEKALRGDVEKCLNPSVFKRHKEQTKVTCYHFDSDLNPHQISGVSQTLGTTDGTDGNGEACLVTFARSQISEAKQTVDQALELVKGLMCQAKKDGRSSELPEAGEEVDLGTSMKNAASEKNMFSKMEAKIARIDDGSGDPIYKTTVTVGGTSFTESEINLIHSPAADGTSKGTLWMKQAVGGQAQMAQGQQFDNNNTVNKRNVMSINYANVLDGSEQRMRFEVRQAMIEKSFKPFTDEGLVNYAALPDEAQNSQIHAINYVAFDVNAETNAGKLSYWQNPGGGINEPARGFLFDISADSTGILSGCGVSGSTTNVSIRKALVSPSATNVLAPARYWHPQGDENTHPQKDPRYDAEEGFKITKQCFKQNATGVYAIDTTQTAHERGYDVIEVAASSVKPPKVPEAKLQGKFVKEE